MNLILLITGSLITFWVIIEALWTTLWVDGTSSPVTGWLTTGIWKVFRGTVPTANDKWLSLAGPTILAATVTAWVAGLWVGWTLIFWSGPHIESAPVAGAEIGFADAGWYVAYTMFTVGNGEFNPSGNLWQLLSAVVAFSGMGLVTLSITYLLQVISAVTNKRAFSSQVTGIGGSAEEFVLRQWTGDGFGAIELQLNSLSQQLSLLSEQHLAFPILHYYHAARPEKSQDVAIAILDDAMTMIRVGVEEEYRPARTILIGGRASVDSFLTTLRSAFISPSGEIPAPPELDRLRAAGIPVVSVGEFHDRLRDEETRRKLILGLLKKGEWRWPGTDESISP